MKPVSVEPVRGDRVLLAVGFKMLSWVPKGISAKLGTQKRVFQQPNITITKATIEVSEFTADGN